MDGRGTEAQVAQYIASKNWQRLYGLLAGLGSHEERVQTISAACQAVNHVRVAYLILDAAQHIHELERALVAAGEE